MNIKTADRINTVKEYYFSQKLREIDELNRQGKNIINLGIGSPDLAPDNAIINALIESAKNPNNHAYQSYKGAPDLRSAIAQWYNKIYGVQLNPTDEILPLIGSKEGIMHISMTYLNPGDEVLIPDPGYPTYTSATNLAGGKVVKYQLKEENNWHPSVEYIQSLITNKTKLIWINYPHMPTGTQTNLDKLKGLLELAKKENLLVCNDNPYSLTLNDNPTSIFQIGGAKDIALELNSLSKSHSMAGWRLGWIAGNSERINEILKFKSNMDSGMFLPIQHAAIKALSLDKSYHDEINKTYAKRRELAWELLDILNCKYNKNQVGMFVWAKIPNDSTDSSSFADNILYNANVFITPGIIFGATGQQYIRISLCTKERVFEEAISRIKAIVK
ncbi:MAG: aminotransferase class I/II-fold pyridoxal phosphate-dependent enzyme [Vicingus serpentipes]|nr:aminotransferase class I/II-fold pyridoxal phosphate-dependent enzyme [Vicingus serpentipes]